jgi:hypothetical protein
MGRRVKNISHGIFLQKLKQLTGAVECSSGNKGVNNDSFTMPVRAGSRQPGSAPDSGIQIRDITCPDIHRASGLVRK